MGKGVALEFKKRWPEMFEDYREECKLGRVQPGQLHLWRNKTELLVINFPTKRHWRDKSHYEDIDCGLVALHDLLCSIPQGIVTLPALGCGHGGLNWGVVKAMIEKHLSDVPQHILVFSPEDSRRMT